MLCGWRLETAWGLYIIIVLGPGRVEDREGTVLYSDSKNTMALKNPRMDQWTAVRRLCKLSVLHFFSKLVVLAAVSFIYNQFHSSMQPSSFFRQLLRALNDYGLS